MTDVFEVIRCKGRSPRVVIGNESSGIMIEFVKSKDLLCIHGWYDSFVGIEGACINIQHFLEAIDISPNKLRRIADMIDYTKGMNK